MHVLVSVGYLLSVFPVDAEVQRFVTFRPKFVDTFVYMLNIGSIKFE